MLQLNAQILKYVAQKIDEVVGIQYTEDNYYQLESRLQDLCKSLKIESTDTLWKLIYHDQDAKIMDQIYDLSTNNETSFFRDPTMYAAFKDIILEGRPFGNRTAQLWCAASSTGQEPYSVAMMCETAPGFSYEIHATDFSNRVLERCRHGVYSNLEVQRGLRGEFKRDFFEAHDLDSNQWKIKDSIRNKVSFEFLNLIDRWPPDHGPFDVVFCRNVLIYQTVEMKKKIIEQICDILNDPGYLILGGTESIVGLSNRFDSLSHHGGGVIYQKKG
ncbi:MAG: protein-glutamate O-methyltransferase CheR [Zetaproteobacteria bacterium]|nr:protein-glutamate O-methyltransferase CheR [Zetaproteobacteria bacterium]